MSKSDSITLIGVIVEQLPGLKYIVKVQDEYLGEMVIEAYMSGKMVKNYITVIIGDKVIVEVSPYDLGKGRIIRRENVSKINQE